MKKQQVSLPRPPDVAVCAYLIWEEQGRPPGGGLAHWIQAEEQIQADFEHELKLLCESPVQEKRPIKQLL